MTKEEHKHCSEVRKLNEEMPTMRRSKSLNELPGNLQVPILRRKGTERTKARLDAIAAGVEELRVLREQQQLLMDQTMASAQPKRKYSCALGDHHRFQQASMWHSISPLSSWHSVSHLTSICEELDNTSNTQMKKSVRNPMETSCKNYSVQDSSIRSTSHKNHHSRERDNYSQHPGLKKPLEHRDQFENHPSEKMIKTDSEEPTRTENKRKSQYATLDIKTERNQDSKYLDRKFSHSQAHKPTEDYKRLCNLADSSQRCRTILSQSDQFFSRCSSWSAQGSSFNCPDANRNLEHSTSSQRTVENETISPSLNLMHMKTTSPTSKSICGKEVKSSLFPYRKHGIQTQQHGPGFSFGKVQSFYPQTRVKSISWDNLLIAIGLQTNGNTTSNEITEQGIDDEIFVNTVDLEQNTGHSPVSENEDGQVLQIKKKRSQSFTSGFSAHSHSSAKYMSKIDSPCYYDPGNRILIVSSQEKNTDEMQSTSILRRASIQCEAVITKPGSHPKIMNPLHNVDISSLQSPGPLHAVTLQYSNIPGRRTSDSNTTTSLSIYSEPTVKNVPVKHFHGDHSHSTKNVVQTLQPISENGYTEQSKHELDDKHGKLTHPRTDQKFRQRDHPVPRPRKSVTKTVLSKEETCNTVNDVVENSVDLTISDQINCPTSQEHDTQREKKTGNQDQSTTLLEPNIQTSCIIKNKEPGDLIKNQNLTSSNPLSENRDFITKHSSKEIFLKWSELSVSPDSEACCSVAESFKVLEQNVLDGLGRKNESVQGDPCISEQNSPEKPSLSEADSDAKKSMPERLVKQTHIDTVEQEENKSMSSCTSTSYGHHTHDFSILSDEGYSTCDSINPQSYHKGQTQFCDVSTLDCRGVVNISNFPAYISSQEPNNYSLKQDIGSFISENSAVKEKRFAKNTNKYGCEVDCKLDIYNAQSEDNISTTCLTADKFSTMESKQNSCLIAGDSTAATISSNSFNPEFERASDTMNITISKQCCLLAGSKIEGNKDNILKESRKGYEKAINISTMKVQLKNSSDIKDKISHYHPEEKQTTMMEDYSPFRSESIALTKASNPSDNKADSVVSHSFKQTAV